MMACPHCGERNSVKRRTCYRCQKPLRVDTEEPPPAELTADTPRPGLSPAGLAMLGACFFATGFVLVPVCRRAFGSWDAHGPAWWSWVLYALFVACVFAGVVLVAKAWRSRRPAEGERAPWHGGAVGCVGYLIGSELMGALLSLAVAGLFGGRPHPPPRYTSPDDKLYTGVRLYTWSVQQGMTYVCEVLGGNERYTDPASGQVFRAVKVRYPDGSEEWVDRQAIVGTMHNWRGGRVYVRTDDPALKRRRWRTYSQ
jgi:hypothetical protein